MFIAYCSRSFFVRNRTVGFSSAWITILLGDRFLWEIFTFGYRKAKEHDSPKRLRKTWYLYCVRIRRFWQSFLAFRLLHTAILSLSFRHLSSQVFLQSYKVSQLLMLTLYLYVFVGIGWILCLPLNWEGRCFWGDPLLSSPGGRYSRGVVTVEVGSLVSEFYGKSYNITLALLP